MKQITYFLNALAVAAIIGTGAMMIWGCEGGSTYSSLTDSPSLMAVSVQQPAVPTAADSTRAKVKPPAGKEAATLPPILLSGQQGSTITAIGDSPALQLDFGSDGVIDGNVGLTESTNDRGLVMAAPAILPEGRNTLSLTPGTSLSMVLADNSGGELQVTVSKLDTIFTVTAGATPTWTLPASCLVKCGRHNSQAYIDGTRLILRWDPKTGSVPPSTVTVRAKFFQGDTMVLDAEKVITVKNNEAVFEGNSQIYFDRLEAEFEL